jgi:hypothetical protein
VGKNGLEGQWLDPRRKVKFITIIRRVFWVGTKTKTARIGESR